MSVDGAAVPFQRLKLEQFITALLDDFGTANPESLARMHLVVGDRRARIQLDDEGVDIWFGAEGLRVAIVDADTHVDGVGVTNSATVLALMDGYLEVVDAVLNGLLEVYGAPEDITRIFIAIELLLDASPRTPSMQALAARYRRERRMDSRLPMPAGRRSSWYPFGPSVSEYELLSRNHLIPDNS